MTPERVKKQVEGLNRLMSDAYRRDIRLSLLLEELGFTPEQIGLLRREYLLDLVDVSLELIQTAQGSTLAAQRRYQVLVRRYSLDGAPPDTLRTIGGQLGISHERVRQVVAQALRYCANRQGRAQFQLGLRAAAIQPLDLSPEEVPPPPSPPPPTPVPEYVLRAREQYPRAYEPWTEEEEERLGQRFRQGKTIEELSADLQRQPSAIRGRLHKLGVLEEE